MKIANKCTHYLDDIIDDRSVENITNALSEFFDGEFTIVIRHNMGGVLRCVQDLIDEISYCKEDSVTIIIEAEGYIVSAAAFLYFSLLIRSQSGEFRHVSVKEPSPPVLVVYHKPRTNERSGYMQFLENMLRGKERDGLISDMDKWEKETDTLLPEILKLIGYDKHIGKSFNNDESGDYISQSDHALCAYNRNYEFVFRYPES